MTGGEQRYGEMALMAGALNARAAGPSPLSSALSGGGQGDWQPPPCSAGREHS